MVLVKYCVMEDVTAVKVLDWIMALRGSARNPRGGERWWRAASRVRACAGLCWPLAPPDAPMLRWGAGLPRGAVTARPPGAAGGDSGGPGGAMRLAEGTAPESPPLRPCRPLSCCAQAPSCPRRRCRRRCCRSPCRATPARHSQVDEQVELRAGAQSQQGHHGVGSKRLSAFLQAAGAPPGRWCGRGGQAGEVRGERRTSVSWT